MTRALQVARGWSAAFVALFATLACAPRDGGSASADSALTARDGDAIAVTLARPAFTFTDTRDAAFDFRARTAGRLTFLFFGYTHCPDVCPVHAANLAAALRTLSYDDRARIDVVFVTVDPARDSALTLRRWLDAFDPAFVGLRAPLAAVDSLLAGLGLGGAVLGGRTATGEYDVGHPSPMLVFAPDDTAHAMYPFGTRQAEWVRIIPTLLKTTRAAVAKSAVGQPSQAGAAQWPAAAGASLPAAAGAQLPATASVRVESAWIVRPAGDAPAAIYLTVVNDAAVADTLLGIGGDVARTITLHEPVRMAAVNAFSVAAHGTLYLAPGGAHAMAAGLYRRLERGGRIALTVRFSTAGAVRTVARVIDYADVDSAVLRRRQR